MKKNIIIIVFLLFTSVFAYSQNTITGTFSGLANQQIKLLGFHGLAAYAIDSVQADEKGVFKLSYSKQDFGMAYLKAEDEKTFVVLLADKENLKLKGLNLALPESLKIIEGEQNILFGQYATEHPRREQTLSAWDYLEKIYQMDSLFALHEVPKQAIEKEKQRIKKEDSMFLTSLPESSYVSWYLPLRKLVSSVATVAQYRTEEIPATINAFREIDYTDKRLHKSGILGETIEAQFWLIENSGRSLDAVYMEMTKSIDGLIDNLLADEQKFNEISNHLFKFLEKRSLFQASEYLALKLLNENACTVNNNLSAQLESYRAMKKGNTAPDFEFKGDVIAPGFETTHIPETLSAVESDYIAVVFGASWCPTCPQELLQISGLYENWKQYSVEVVFVSLDEDETTFKSFSGVFPFISTCDYQKWESPIVKDYHVFATPTTYLLDKKLEIILRPNSVSHLDSWIDWHLVNGNK